VSARRGPALSRRQFLTRSAITIGGALVVGIELDKGIAWASPATTAATAGGPVGVYVTVNPDETITLVCPGSEMGQGIATALPMILAEELMVDWESVRVHLAEANAVYNRPIKDATTGIWAPGTSQSSGGSNSVRMYHDYLRTVGATVRQKMIWAAASLNGLTVAELRAEHGTVVRTSDSSLVATYGQLAATAATMEPTDVAWVQPPYRFIGQPMARLDVPAKVDGSAVFGIDVRLDGMRYAAIKQAPKVGQTVGTIGTPPAGTTVVALSSGTAVAVVHPRSSWDAMRAAAALPVTWVDAVYTPNIDTAALRTRAQNLMSTGTALSTSPVVGDANAVLAATAPELRISRQYSAPYLNHTPLEPMNATALVTDTTCEIWAPTQSQTRAVTEATTATGLAATAVTLHTTYLGGGFGRRLANDYVRQVVEIANAHKGIPIKLTWTREEDLSHDIHRPASLVNLDAAVDAGGAVTAFKARVVCGSSQRSSTDGLVNSLYSFPAQLVEYVADTVEVPLGSWRSVGNSQNCYFIESFLDEVALATSQDPIALRRRLLNSGNSPTPNQQRALAVLDRLETESGWSTAPATGRARGVALSMSFGDTVVGEVAEVSAVTGGYKVWKVTVVIDPGSVVNPDTVRAQVESAVIQGLGAAMYQETLFSAGAVVRKNFDTYRMILMKEAPVEINTVIIESGAPMGGIGEPGLPPIAPAVVSAIARLNGTRVRTLPIVQPPPPPPPPTPPTITSFTPTSGNAKTIVTITGTNFDTATKVTLAGMTCSFTKLSATQVRVTLPKKPKTGKFALTNKFGTATAATNFTVTL
jgi:isoquinoline 1-oxidoreductase beta subunit